MDERLRLIQCEAEAALSESLFFHGTGSGLPARMAAILGRSAAFVKGSVAAPTTTSRAPILINAAAADTTAAWIALSTSGSPRPR